MGHRRATVNCSDLRNESCWVAVEEWEISLESSAIHHRRIIEKSHGLVQKESHNLW